MRDIDRREFLRLGVGTAGAVVLGACGGGSPQAPSVVSIVPSPTVPARPAAELPAAPRRTLRLAGRPEFGAPYPFHYLPPAYQQVLYIYDTLLLVDATGALIPWLAARYEASPDGLTHTFELRDGIRWHDGRPLTSDDVVFTFDYVAAKRAENKLVGLLFGLPEDVASVRAVGPRGVQVVLQKPSVNFATRVAAALPIVPAHVWSQVADPGLNTDFDLFVGSGPYRIKKADETGALYVANDDFFLGRPFTERIELIPVGDELSALSSGAIDAAGVQATPTSAAALRRFQAKADSYTVLTGAFDFLITLNWNLTKPGPLADVRFRHACALAINRGDLVRRLLAGNGAPGNPGFLAPDHPMRVDVEQYAYDRAAAERLLDEAGYRRGEGGVRRGPDGSRLAFKLAVAPVTAAVAQVVVTHLEAVGIEVSLDPVDQEFFIPGTYDMALFFYGGAGGDPDVMRLYSSKGEDAFFSARGYANTEFDELVDAQRYTLDPAERSRMVARMQQIVAADLPVLPLYYPTPILVLDREEFDQVAFPPGAGPSGGPLNKQAIVTGVVTGGTEIRPIR